MNGGEGHRPIPNSLNNSFSQPYQQPGLLDLNNKAGNNNNNNNNQWGVGRVGGGVAGVGALGNPTMNGTITPDPNNPFDSMI